MFLVKQFLSDTKKLGAIFSNVSRETIPIRHKKSSLHFFRMFHVKQFLSRHFLFHTFFLFYTRKSVLRGGLFMLC